MREAMPALALTALMACNGDKVSKLDTAGALPDSAGAPEANAGLSTGRNPGCVMFQTDEATQLQGLLATLEDGPTPLWECSGTLLADDGEIGTPVEVDGARNLNWTGMSADLTPGTHEICISLATECPSGMYNYAVANQPDFVVSGSTAVGGEFPVDFVEIDQ